MRAPEKSSSYIADARLIDPTQQVKNGISADRDKGKSMQEPPKILPEIQEEEKSEKPSIKSKSERHQPSIESERNFQIQEN